MKERKSALRVQSVQSMSTYSVRPLECHGMIGDLLYECLAIPDH